MVDPTPTPAPIPSLPPAPAPTPAALSRFAAALARINAIVTAFKAKMVKQPNWFHVLVVVLSLVSWGYAAYTAIQNGQPIPQPPIDALISTPVDEAKLEVNSTGYTPDADAADRDARNAQFQNFAATPAGQVGDIPKEVFLWQAEQKLTGKPCPAKDQNPAGACVGFGDTTGAERSLATDVLFRGGQPSEFTHFSEEVTYAGGKVIGARSLGASVSRQDGSATVFTKAFFAAGYGMVPKAKYGDVDLTEYSAKRAQSWNTSGPPKDILEVSKKFPVNSLAKVTSWDQGKKAMASGYGLGMDSNLSATAQRDANGIAQETREGWSHCMCVDGYTVINGEEYGHVENSWSNIPDARGNRSGKSYHNGPVGPGNPTTAGFWIHWKSLDKAFKAGGTFAISGVTGFPARKLPPLDWAGAAPKTDVAFADPFRPFNRRLMLLRSTESRRAVRSDFALAP